MTAAAPAAPADPKLTIAEVVLYFGGDVTADAVRQWLRRDLLVEAGRDQRNRVLVRLSDARAVEARTWSATRGRPRGACASP